MTRGNHTPAEAAHLTKVAALGCLCCRLERRPYTPACIHHIREGYGMGQRASHFEVLPLCEGHHQGLRDTSKLAFHRDPETWRATFGSERQLVALLNEMIQSLDAENPHWWEFAPEVLSGEVAS